jgi:hypothetical protein
MGSMIVTSSSAAAQGRAEMCLTRFYVHNAEDIASDGDEPYLVVGNTELWRAPKSMDNGAVAAVQKTVHAGDVVEAYDTDSSFDDDDFAGSAKVGDKEGSLNFYADGIHYRALYSRGPCPQ